MARETVPKGFWTRESIGRLVDLTARLGTERGRVAFERESGERVSTRTVRDALVRLGMQPFPDLVRRAKALAKRALLESGAVDEDEAEETFLNQEEEPVDETERDLDEPCVEEAVDLLEEHRHKEALKHAEEKTKRLLKELHEKDEQLEILKELRSAPPIGPIEAPRGRGEGKQRLGCPVMLCSDWHVEERVDPAKVNGLNEYNLEIAERCIERMGEDYVWLSRDPRFDCRQGVVWLGGDLFSGWIHQELQESNFLAPTRATLWLQERIERMLRFILAEMPNLDRLIVPCNDGNHGRLTHKIRVSTRTENSLEHLMYANLAYRMRDEPRVQFQIAEGEYNYLQVFDTTLCFFHGDSVGYQGGVGGISIPLNKAFEKLYRTKPMDVLCLGHFHTRTDLGHLVVNGSAIGPTPYSLHIKANPEPRQQTWFLVDASQGKCLSAPVWLPRT